MNDRYKLARKIAKKVAKWPEWKKAGFRSVKKEDEDLKIFCTLNSEQSE